MRGQSRLLAAVHYSAIGDNVNIASRFEGLSKAYGVPIVIGEQTLERLNGVAAIELDMMRVKGRAQPTRIYSPMEVFGASGASGEELLARHQAMLAAYRRQDSDGAEAAIGECEGAGIEGLSGFYAVYRERIAEWRQIRRRPTGTAPIPRPQNRDGNQLEGMAV